MLDTISSACTSGASSLLVRNPRVPSPAPLRSGSGRCFARSSARADRADAPAQQQQIGSARGALARTGRDQAVASALCSDPAAIIAEQAVIEAENPAP